MPFSMPNSSPVIAMDITRGIAITKTTRITFDPMGQPASVFLQKGDDKGADGAEAIELAKLPAMKGKMAAAFGVRCVPHVWGTGVGLATALQLLAVLPHNPPRHTPLEPILEFDRSEHPFRQAVLTQPIEHVCGFVRVPDGPGLGIEIEAATLKQFGDNQ